MNIQFWQGFVLGISYIIAIGGIIALIESIIEYKKDKAVKENKELKTIIHLMKTKDLCNKIDEELKNIDKEREDDR